MRNFTLFIVGLLFSSPCLVAQETDPWDSLTGPSFFQHLSQQSDIPVLRIETNWKKLVWNKRKEEYIAGKMQFEAEEEAALNFNIRLRARGNMRKEVCHYPPLKIKMKKKALTQMGFSKLNDLKMVVQCGKGARGENYLFREYLLYKLHNILSDYTYAIQLVKIEMIQEDKEPNTLYGFLIEDEDDFAYRYRGRVVVNGKVNKNLIQRDALIHLCFFQYMILNNDWSMDNKHNIEFLLPKDSSKIIPVPYDFDYAGLVGTSYAIPDPKMPIESVQEPYFRGRGFSKEEVEAMALHFLSKREEIISYTENYEWLEDKERKKITKWLNQFFDLLENEKKRNREFSRRQ